MDSENLVAKAFRSAWEKSRMVLAKDNNKITHSSSSLSSPSPPQPPPPTSPPPRLRPRQPPHFTRSSIPHNRSSLSTSQSTSSSSSLSSSLSKSSLPRSSLPTSSLPTSSLSTSSLSTSSSSLITYPEDPRLHTRSRRRTLTRSTESKTSKKRTSGKKRRVIYQNPKWSKKHWHSVSFSACGLHVFYMIASAFALLDAGICVDVICAASGGVFGGMAYLFDWRKRASCSELIALLPKGKLAKNEPVCTWISKWLCGPPKQQGPCNGNNNNRNYNRPFGADGMGSDIGIDLALDRAIGFAEYLLCQEGPHAYKRLNGRLQVTLTRCDSLPFYPCVIDEWCSNEDFIECLRAATTIPTKLGDYRLSYCWRGKQWFDGGLYIFHPILNPRTVCVSTFPFSIRMDQPAYKAKRCGWSRASNWPEISCDFGDYGSEEIVCDEFYACLWKRGYNDTRCFIDRH